MFYNDILDNIDKEIKASMFFGKDERAEGLRCAKMIVIRNMEKLKCSNCTLVESMSLLEYLERRKQDGIQEQM